MLSDLCEANDPFFLKEHDVQAILYFGEGGMFPDDIKLYMRSLGPGNRLTPELLRDGIDFLRESLRAGRRVLAVGSSGATIVGGYLSEMGFGTAQAIAMIRESHGRIPSPDAAQVEAHSRNLEQRGRMSLNHRV